MVSRPLHNTTPTSSSAAVDEGDVRQDVLASPFAGKGAFECVNIVFRAGLMFVLLALSALPFVKDLEQLKGLAKVYLLFDHGATIVHNRATELVSNGRELVATAQTVYRYATTVLAAGLLMHVGPVSALWDAAERVVTQADMPVSTVTSRSLPSTPIKRQAIQFRPSTPTSLAPSLTSSSLASSPPSSVESSPAASQRNSTEASVPVIVMSPSSSAESISVIGDFATLGLAMAAKPLPVPKLTPVLAKRRSFPSTKSAFQAGSNVRNVNVEVGQAYYLAPPPQRPAGRVRKEKITAARFATETPTKPFKGLEEYRSSPSPKTTRPSTSDGIVPRRVGLVEAAREARASTEARKARSVEIERRAAESEQQKAKKTKGKVIRWVKEHFGSKKERSQGKMVKA